MKYLHTLSFVILLCASIGTSASDAKKVVPNGPYSFCNVYLADGCFGIVQGDVLTMQVVMDFVEYEVRFSSGATAHLYSGFNPNLSESAGIDFIKCAWQSGFSECKTRSLPGGRIEYLARRNSQSTSIHLVIDASQAKENSESFIRNIRACSTKSGKIQCIENARRAVN